MYGYIYLTTNLVNGKKYIGQTSKNLDDYLGSGKAIVRALRKYGKENFKKEILAHANSQQELDELEKHYIDLNNAVEDRNFYNIAEGGNGNPLAGKTEQEVEEIKDKIKSTMKSKGTHSGENNPFYGKTHSDELKEKWKGKRRYVIHYKLVNIETGEEIVFDKRNSIAEYLGYKSLESVKKSIRDGRVIKDKYIVKKM